jgi:hypothetical protein
MPPPRDQIIVRQMLVQELKATAPITLGILKPLTNLPDRFSLPRHLDGRDVPSGMSRNAFV